MIHLFIWWNFLWKNVYFHISGIHSPWENLPDWRANKWQGKKVTIMWPTVHRLYRMTAHAILFCRHFTILHLTGKGVKMMKFQSSITKLMPLLLALANKKNKTVLLLVNNHFLDGNTHPIVDSLPITACYFLLRKRRYKRHKMNHNQLDIPYMSHVTL